MCPACLSTAAWLILGGTSAGGLLTAALAKLRTANSAAAGEARVAAPPEKS